MRRLVVLLVVMVLFAWSCGPSPEERLDNLQNDFHIAATSWTSSPTQENCRMLLGAITNMEDFVEVLSEQSQESLDVLSAATSLREALREEGCYSEPAATMPAQSPEPVVLEGVGSRVEAIELTTGEYVVAIEVSNNYTLLFGDPLPNNIIIWLSNLDSDQPYGYPIVSELAIQWRGERFLKVHGLAPVPPGRYAVEVEVGQHANWQIRILPF